MAMSGVAKHGAGQRAANAQSEDREQGGTGKVHRHFARFDDNGVTVAMVLECSWRYYFVFPRVRADSNCQGGMVDVVGGKKRVGSTDGRKESNDRERWDRLDSCNQCE